MKSGDETNKSAAPRKQTPEAAPDMINKAGQQLSEQEEGAALPLHHLDHFPKSLLYTPASDLKTHLEGPTLIAIKGRQQRPLFISVLMHGNETTGWQAVQKLMQDYQSKPLPRSLLLFIANIEAASANLRTLPTQLDYNRAWPGTKHPEAREARMLAALVEKLKQLDLFASIDIHNNTGNNPLYSCVNQLDDRDLHLASLFSHTIVYFLRPRGVQSIAMAPICPAITIECGLVGNEKVVEQTTNFLETALTLEDWPANGTKADNLHLMKTHAIVKLPPKASLSFNGEDADFRFPGNLDDFNFRALPKGTIIGTVRPGSTARLELHPGEFNTEIPELLTYVGENIELAAPAIPAMLTMDERAIRADCLGYLMHPIDLEEERAALKEHQEPPKPRSTERGHE